MSEPRRVLLLGGGHSHVEVLRQFAMNPPPNASLTLLTRDLLAPYSGMLPGYIAGHYTYAECHIDLRPLAKLAKARICHGEAHGIDLNAGLVRVPDRPDLRFDVLSINIGSRPAMADIPGAREHAIPAKPVDALIAAWQRVRADLIDTPRPHRFVVVGGGAGGVELALTMQHQLQSDLGPDAERVDFTLLTASDDILPTHNLRARRRMNRVVQRRDITLIAGETATQVTASEVRCESGRAIPYDTLIWTTHAAPARWLPETGLALDNRGFILVDETLQSVSHANVFAGGDIASLRESPRPKSGVFAVREGPHLAENLRRFLGGQPLEPYDPQRNFLSLISTGDKNAIASRGRWAFEGKILWQWKDWIDRRWMTRYQIGPEDLMTRMREMDEAHTQAVVSESDDGFEFDAMQCAGCGAKLGHEQLGAALQRLETAGHKDVLIGLDAPDDAAVVEIPPGNLTVQSVDFFPALVDDPFTFGEVAAHHCLNDLYAMGACPHTAMAIVTLPKADPLQQEDTLAELLAGALSVLMREHATLVGGHTLEGDTLSFGLSAQGIVARERMLQDRTPRSGDVIILTKPIGTGVVFAADMRSRAETPWLDEALDSMRQSNAEAADVLCHHHPSSCTDVTGFGLAGHLLELIDDAGRGAEVTLDSIPVFDGARSASQQGFRSSLYPANARREIDIEATPLLRGNPNYPLLFDPQTSGGLLSAVPADHAEACLQVLRHAGYKHAAAIGTLIDRPKDASRIVLR